MSTTADDDLDALLGAVERAAARRDATLEPRGRKKGVVHTPARLARVVVAEAEALLERARLPAIGDARLEIVDPAVGPGVFVAAALAHAPSRGGGRLVGLDVDPAAALETRALLERVGAARGYRVRLETRDALRSPYRARAPNLLVVGNPPWSAGFASAEPLRTLLSDFRLDERGAPLRERRAGVLSDAYVHFLRWAADAVIHAREGGALALVTNGSYLDGPVHRGVRAFLVARFDEVSVIDLGGSALVARAPGTLDENVFGVRPSAAILLAARRGQGARRARVYYRRVTGRVEEKLAALEAGAPLEPVEEPLGALRPRARATAAWASWPSLSEWLPFHGEGLQTNRDPLVSDRDRGALLERLDAIADGALTLASSRHFDAERARRALAALRAGEGLDRHLVEVAYRPFETRWVFVHPALCHRPRPLLLRALARHPLALVSVRKDRGGLPWAHAALVRAPVDNCYLSTRSSCRARAFPALDPDGRPNVAPPIAEALAARGIEPAPTAVLRYLAAALSSPRYASAHADALALDYPRIPLPRDRDDFARLAALGERLERLLASAIAPPPRGATSSELLVGHHRFDARDPTIGALAALRAEVDGAPRGAPAAHPVRDEDEKARASEPSAPGLW